MERSAIGAAGNDSRAYLEDKYEDDLTLEAGVALALEALASVEDASQRRKSAS